MKILGIETSCDETAASVVEDGHQILSNVVVSQIDIFKSYGGVIPEIAARSHLEAILPVIDKSLTDAELTWHDIDAISVTNAPGLLGSLLIGTLTARTLAILHQKPLYATHHLKSHIYSNWLDLSLEDSKDPNSPRISAPPKFPLLALVISGGHTQIIRMTKHNHFEIIGTTLDDAVGECFDKVAKILGLPYPGGPAISNAALGHITLAAETSNQNSSTPESHDSSLKSYEISPGNRNRFIFPHPNVQKLDFSFSGLKTAVLRTVQKELGFPIDHPSYDLKNHLTPEQIADFAASFEKTAIDILLEKLSKALKDYPDTKSLVFAGGVSANSYLREAASAKFNSKNPVFPLKIYFPAKNLSGDNGAMVASAAYYEITSGVQPTDPYSLNIYPRIEIS